MIQPWLAAHLKPSTYTATSERVMWNLFSPAILWQTGTAHPRLRLERRPWQGYWEVQRERGEAERLPLVWQVAAAV